MPLPGGNWTLADARCGEVFHPNLGAEQEAELLFIRPTGLREALAEAGAEPVVVWDVGLGAAGNACAVLRAWRELGRRPLELWSFDRDRLALRAARAFRMKEPGAFAWLEEVPEELFEDGEVVRMANRSGAQGVWRVVERDFVEWVAEQNCGAHGPFLVMMDLYSPEASIREWTLEHWKEVRRVMKAGAGTRLVFHSRSTAVRVTLLLAGFEVGRGPELGMKEETTVAALEVGQVERPLGKDFLEKVRRSTHAAPFRAGGRDRRGPIGEEDWVELSRRAQFRPGSED